MIRAILCAKHTSRCVAARRCRHTPACRAADLREPPSPHLASAALQLSVLGARRRRTRKYGEAEGGGEEGTAKEGGPLSLHSGKGLPCRP